MTHREKLLAYVWPLVASGRMAPAPKQTPRRKKVKA